MQLLTVIISFILLFQLCYARMAKEAACDYVRYESTGCPDPESECEDSICTCPPTAPNTLYASDGYPICLQQKQYEEECFVNEQCEYEEISGMECSPTSNIDADLATNAIIDEILSSNVSAASARTL